MSDQLNNAPPPADLLIHGLAEIATPRGSTSRAGAEQRRVERRRAADSADGTLEVLCRDGRILFVGSEAERREQLVLEIGLAEEEATRTPQGRRPYQMLQE